MVRAGVRTLTLSVLSVREPLLQQVVASQPAAAYFDHVAQYMTQQVKVRVVACGRMGREHRQTQCTCDTSLSGMHVQL